MYINMGQFHSTGHLMNILKMDKLDITEQELEDYAEAFRLFDRDEDGTINADELNIVLRTLGQNPTTKDVEKMLKEIDNNGNGTIEFHEFLLMMVNYQKTSFTEDHILEAFRILDIDGDGLISDKELKYAMVNLGEKMPEKEAEEMVRAADVNGDGVIDYAGFVKIMSQGLQENIN